MFQFSFEFSLSLIGSLFDDSGEEMVYFIINNFTNTLMLILKYFRINGHLLNCLLDPDLSSFDLTDFLLKGHLTAFISQIVNILSNLFFHHLLFFPYHIFNYFMFRFSQEIIYYHFESLLFFLFVFFCFNLLLQTVFTFHKEILTAFIIP